MIEKAGPLLAALAAMVLGLAGCSWFGGDSARPWLCRPGDADDLCGQTSATHDIDCFYLYPTVSADQAANSDLDVGDQEEVAATLAQAGPLAQHCDVFAPAYRQMTGLQLLAEGLDEEALEKAYADVRDAWDEYVEPRDPDRPVLLFGHSQGAAMLERLLEDEEVRPVLDDHLVAAYLIGWPATVPGLAPCADPSQTGCLVSYSSFSVTDPPVDSFFGRPLDDDGEAVCTNPADLSGAAAPLHPGLPGSATARCVDEGGFRYLQVTMDETLRAAVGPDRQDDWGLHQFDVVLAQGDLAGLIDAQSAAFVASHPAGGGDVAAD